MSEHEWERLFDDLWERVNDAIAAQEERAPWEVICDLGDIGFDRHVVVRLMRDAYDVGMEEMTAAQILFSQGVAKGRELARVEVRRADLLLVGEERFGSPDAATQAILDQIGDVSRLERLIRRAVPASTWQELLGGEE